VSPPASWTAEQRATFDALLADPAQRAELAKAMDTMADWYEQEMSR
jgi:hypothetical protein